MYFLFIYIYIYIYKSLCCTSETNTTLQFNYISILKKDPVFKTFHLQSPHRLVTGLSDGCSGQMEQLQFLLLAHSLNIC